MPVTKTTIEPTPAADVRQRHARTPKPQREPGRQMEFLSLQLEDDAGGDPYNRTGQHCLADLKQIER